MNSKPTIQHSVHKQAAKIAKVILNTPPAQLKLRKAGRG